MRKKKRSTEGKVWTDALNNLEKVHQNKYSLTKDTLHERSRPEPEIIEHILEELENKIRFYFKLYKMEKDKRTDCEKKNYYLHEELNQTYTTLEKNKLYTDKLENKLHNIKENQSSLIDTVRRIDLLYIQLDTLVQSFSGVCTQVAAEVNAYGMNTNSRRNTMKTLLDYIYPCRTLDPRINSLYGVLYYGSIGLLKDGKFQSPPIPPIPPVVPSEGDGWLPPSRYAPHNDVVLTDSHQRSSHLGAPFGGSFSDPMRQSGSGTSFNKESSKENYADDTLFSKYVEDEQNKQVRRNEYDMNKPNFSHLIPQDLQGFCIKIGFLEISYKKENARIICVVRYDSETSTSAIQNTSRVTKPRDMNGRANGGKYIFNIDYTINLTSLPQKNAGDIPSFMIDVHDVNGKTLVGSARCSFISEKTLMRDASWDIYSRVANAKPEIIGKMHVSVFACPQNSLLPAEIFNKARQQSTLGAPYGESNPSVAPSGDDRKVESNVKVTFQKSALLSKSIEERDQPSQMGVKPPGQPHVQSQVKPQGQSPVKPPGQPLAQPLSANNTGKGASLVKRGNKVNFKPYTSKNVDPASSTDANKSNTDVKGSTPQKGASKGFSVNRKNGDSSKHADSGNKSVTPVGSQPTQEGEKSGTISLIQSRIRNLAKQFESKNDTSGGTGEDASSGSTTPVKGSASKLGGPLKKGLPLSSSKGASVPEAKNGEPQGEQKVGQTEGKTAGQKVGQAEGQTEGQKAALEKGPVGLKKSSPMLKEGMIKIKLPLLGKKDLAKKADPVTSAKSDTSALAKNDPVGVAQSDAAPPAKSDPADAAKKDSDLKDSDLKDNNVASKTIKPILKIKVEPKKENLNKLFKKMPLKTPLASKEQEEKDSGAAKKATPSEKLTAKTAASASQAAPPSAPQGAAPPKAEPELTKVEKNLEKKTSIKNKMLALLKKNPGDPSAILKKPVPKPVSAAPAEVESQSSTDGPDLKNLLEKAKKNAIYIDKNKVNVKLNKKVEIKREIKKFVPKLKNFDPVLPLSCRPLAAFRVPAVRHSCRAASPGPGLHVPNLSCKQLA
ncbi:hypothetical protein PCYB_123050 [Plasmodium cynomolgi strain B]|uniref:Uncharacterized protein n=1 Tax=Plasmodium cynomolgi (strain B) TaxID=1120755 RepID=K6UVX5_PLACD|nr:hypothetical protein PCYB_123050 [Plasmodium cynomolgi strain B]GAB67739.1 hypothetical protein PCYB_123050 [Plasmodium cynomolgi strain B]